MYIYPTGTQGGAAEEEKDGSAGASEGSSRRGRKDKAGEGDVDREGGGG